VKLVADCLGVLRLALAVVFPAAVARGGWSAFVLVVLAAATDYVDGPLARRAGRPTAYGTVLDNVADIVFVLVGTATGARYGIVSPLAPAAIACAATAYLAASLVRRRLAGGPVRAYSATGHAAGVCNYVLVALVAGRVALPAFDWSVALAAGTAMVVGLNLAAVALRLRPALRAHASRA
jgi:phosphatidylglycerophosphate synthase